MSLLIDRAALVGGAYFLCSPEISSFVEPKKILNSIT